MDSQLQDRVFFPRTNEHLFVITVEHKTPEWQCCLGKYLFRHRAELLRVSPKQCLSATQSLTYSNLILLLCICTALPLNIPLFLWNLERVKECTTNSYFLLNDAFGWPLREVTLLRLIAFLVWKTHFFPSKGGMSVLGSLTSKFRISLCSLSLTKVQWVEGQAFTAGRQTLWNTESSLTME